MHMFAITFVLCRMTVQSTRRAGADDPQAVDILLALRDHLNAPNIAYARKQDMFDRTPHHAAKWRDRECSVIPTAVDFDKPLSKGLIAGTTVRK
jgi:hypothetical protein